LFLGESVKEHRPKYDQKPTPSLRFVVDNLYKIHKLCNKFKKNKSTTNQGNDLRE